MSVPYSRLCLLLVGFCAITVQALSIRHLHPLSNATGVPNTVGHSNTTGFSNTTELHTYCYSLLDPLEGKSVATWAVYMCDPQATSTDGCESPSIAVNVYVDDLSQPAFSYVPLELEGEAPVHRIWYQRNFRTEHRLIRSRTSTSPTETKYPPNQYYTNALVLIVDPMTNNSLPIKRLTAEGAVKGKGYNIHSLIEVDKATFTSDSGYGLVDTRVEVLKLQIDIKPSGGACALVAGGTIMNAILTLCTVAILFLVILGRLKASKCLVNGFLYLVAPFMVTLYILYTNSPCVAGPDELAEFLVEIFIVVGCCVILLFSHSRPPQEPSNHTG